MFALTHKQLTRTCLLAALIIGLPGCSTWLSGRFEEPEVRLTDIEIVRARLLEQEFLLQFRIDNPNDRSLPVRGLEYKVYINDIELADGSTSAWETVPANGHAYYQVPVHTNLWRHMKYVVRLLERPDRPIQYRLEGKLKTGLMFGRRVQISRDGEIIPADLIPE